MSDEQDQELIRWQRFGQKLERLRIDRGYSQTYVAQQTKLGFGTIAHLEQGGHRQDAGGPWSTPNPKDETLTTLARFYGADVGEWFAEVGRYDERPRTKGSLRRASGRTAERDRIAELEDRVADLEVLADELRRLRGEQEPADGPGRRRRRGTP
jgi:transcriptional regulator with XRE-family HTH domain